MSSASESPSVREAPSTHKSTEQNPTPNARTSQAATHNPLNGVELAPEPEHDSKHRLQRGQRDTVEEEPNHPEGGSLEEKYEQGEKYGGKNDGQDEQKPRGGSKICKEEEQNEESTSKHPHNTLFEEKLPLSENSSTREAAGGRQMTAP
jgi:hypothetical protein